MVFKVVKTNDLGFKNSYCMEDPRHELFFEMSITLNLLTYVVHPCVGFVCVALIVIKVRQAARSRTALSASSSAFSIASSSAAVSNSRHGASEDRMAKQRSRWSWINWSLWETTTSEPTTLVKKTSTTAPTEALSSTNELKKPQITVDMKKPQITVITPNKKQPNVESEINKKTKEEKEETMFKSSSSIQNTQPINTKRTSPKGLTVTTSVQPASSLTNLSKPTNMNARVTVNQMFRRAKKQLKEHIITMTILTLAVFNLCVFTPTAAVWIFYLIAEQAFQSGKQLGESSSASPVDQLTSDNPFEYMLTTTSSPTNDVVKPRVLHVLGHVASLLLNLVALGHCANLFIFYVRVPSFRAALNHLLRLHLLCPCLHVKTKISSQMQSPSVTSTETQNQTHDSLRHFSRGRGHCALRFPMRHVESDHNICDSASADMTTIVSLKPSGPNERQRSPQASAKRRSSLPQEALDGSWKPSSDVEVSPVTSILNQKIFGPRVGAPSSKEKGEAASTTSPVSYTQNRAAAGHKYVQHKSSTPLSRTSQQQQPHIMKQLRSVPYGDRDRESGSRANVHFDHRLINS